MVTPESYIFNYVNTTGSTRVIADEAKHLSEYDLFEEPMLWLVKSHGDIEKQKVLSEIQKLSTPKDESEFKYDEECLAFKSKFEKFAEKVSKERDQLHWKEFLEQHYPPTLIRSDTINQNRSYGVVQVYNENISEAFVVKVNPDWKASDLTREVLDSLRSKVHLASVNYDDYVLRGKGKEFIVGDYPLYSFQYLADAVTVRRGDSSASPYDVQPSLTLLHVAAVRNLLPQNSHSFFEPKADEPPPVPLKNKRNVCSAWQVEQSVNIRVKRATNLPAFEKSANKKDLFVHVGIFHGEELLCESCHTKEPRSSNTGKGFVWDEMLNFNMKVNDLPRCAKICVTLNSIPRNKLSKDTKSIISNSTPVAWVNTTFYDFRGYLKTGRLLLKCWDWLMEQEPDGAQHGFNPRGETVQNHDVDRAIMIELELTELSWICQYPTQAEVLQRAAVLASADKQNMFSKSSRSYIAQLGQIIEKEPSQYTEDELSLLWRLRLDCRDKFPDALPQLLGAVKWKSSHQVALMQALLNAWPQIPATSAISLLDVAHADIQVRQFACNCLDQLSDRELTTYLLQLVQALKFECYVDNSLVKLLLERAWNNRMVGHFFFWFLRAELHNKSSHVMQMRYSVIIQAYLLGNVPHLHNIFRQSEANVKLFAISERAKTVGSDKEQLMRVLRETASQTSFKDAFIKLECALNPKIDLQGLVVEKCKVMDSKMRPLWLVFKQHELDSHVQIIYKNGDDLRQDMLTLQIISIMDQLWKDEGLDLKMLPYSCLATSSDSGLIEVVSPASTIANIQKSKGPKVKSAFRYQTLLEWIEKKASESKIPLQESLDNFTNSCAGYCVATYVLGVGDRHSDNIMVTEKGQLFHIDFGHILGNFKSKYGFKRERVPFVLAHDFVNVINRGKINDKTEFDVFKTLCDRAFMILRKHGRLIITLFSLMLQSGLPELTMEKDLDYLKDTLALHLSDEKALAQFHSKFKKATADAWSTSINWWFHNVRRSNN